MHAGLMQQVHPVWDSLARTCTCEGVALSPSSSRGKRYNPTLRWGMWVPQILVSRPHWQTRPGGAAPLLARAGCPSVGSVGGGIST